MPLFARNARLPTGNANCSAAACEREIDLTYNDAGLEGLT
jgi:hypothetical protein